MPEPKSVEHINWILKTLEIRPYLWTAANTSKFSQLAETTWYTAFQDAINNIPSQYRNQVNQLDHVIDHVIRDFTSELSSNIAWIARGAIVALVAYNDCEQYINMGYEKLLVYAKLSENPQAILLLPMVYVRERLNEYALV